MATYEITGIQIGEDRPFGTEGSLTVNVPGNDTGLFTYVVPGNAPSDGLPLAEVTFVDGATVFLESTDLQDDNNFVDAYILELTWGGGNVTQLLSVDFFAPGFVFYDYLFTLGGTPLPTFADADAFEGFGDTQVEGLTQISSGPLRPGVLVDASDIAGLTQTEGHSLRGTTDANSFTGGSDDDEITGLGGDDTLDGGAGDDVIRGGKQEDVLIGGTGDDKLFGQRNADTLEGGDGNDRLNSGGGNDMAAGGKGNDFVKGGTRNDALMGDNGRDTLVGNSGNDTLEGGKGNDILNGGGDNDLLIGGSGNDWMKGGGGADTFDFSGNHGNDTITDFETGEMGDLLVLAGTGLTNTNDVEDAASQQGSDLLIDTGNGNSILLEGVSISDLSEDAFIF